MVYTRLDRKGLFQSPTGLDCAVSIAHLGRFGNAMAVFVPALARSLQLEFGHIVIHGQSVIGSPDGLIREGQYGAGSNLKFWAGKEPSSRQNDVLHLVIAQRLSFSIDSRSADKAWASTFTLLLPGETVEPEAETCLVIHLRGGDVYGTRLLPNHGQPPLAYYTKILTSGSWSAVKIIHQGPNIPILDPLVEFCRKSNIPVSTQSKSFREDMLSLLGARTLVVGRGSFAPSVVGLSPWVKTVYFFHNGFGINPPKTGLSVRRLRDVGGEFVAKNLSHLWRNTPEQVDLMMTYPEGNLDFDPEDVAM